MLHSLLLSVGPEACCTTIDDMFLHWPVQTARNVLTQQFEEFAQGKRCMHISCLLAEYDELGSCYLDWLYDRYYLCSDLR